MDVRLEAVSFAVVDPVRVAAFWAALLDRDVVVEPGAVLVPGDQRQVGLRFVRTGVQPVGRPRLHLHLTSSSLEDQRRTVSRALDLGGRSIDVGQGPDDAFVVLADPGGGELCVIEPGNRFLAGTGVLGEVTCDASRAVGTFWRDALGWPLVWDSGAQTAVQSPVGGTKLSWDSWPGSAERGPRDLQRFDLVAGDPAAEADRLVCLGATVLHRAPDRVELADPDGDRFSLVRRG